MATSEADLVRDLTDLIGARSPTPPGDVEPVVRWLRERAARLGASFAEQMVEPGTPNVLMELDFGPGPRLVFNTHMDVNAPDVDAWRSDPWTAEVRGDAVFGVGACDAKGSLVAMVAAMEELVGDPSGLGGRLLLTAVMGEEAGGIGSRHLVAVGLEADGAVVGEPTGCAVARAHKGTYMRRLRFHGRTAHSSSPALGRSAITAAAVFTLRYEELNARFAADPHPLVGPATAVVTLARGGERQNTVPGTAEVTIDRRLVPGEDHAAVDRELDELLAVLPAGDLNGIEIEGPEVVVATVPSETSGDAEIVSAAIEAARRHVSHDVRPVGFPAGCDMSKLVHGAGIPTVICGPGDLAQAHAPDEYVPVAELGTAAAIYESLARAFLGRQP